MEVVSPWALVCRNSRFRRLWAAQLISMGGDFINQVALLSLVYQLTGKAVMVAALAVASNLPVFLASPWAGVAADRYDRIRLMFGCDMIRAVLVLGLLAVAPTRSIALALLVVALTETVSAFFEPASAAALPGVVEPAELASAIALSSASWSVMLAVGAALGGVILATLGTEAAILVNSASFLLSALLIASLRQPLPPPSQAPAVQPWRDLRDGFAHVAAHPRLGALLLIKVAFGLGTGVLALLTVLPMQLLHAGQAGVATLFCARGVGAVGGPLLAHLLSRHSLRQRARWAAVGVLSTGLFYALLAHAPSLAWAALWVVLAHIGSGVQWVLSTTLLQQCVDDAFRGRVMAFDFAGVTLSSAVSTLLFGQAMDTFGIRQAGLAGAIALAGFGLIWLVVFGWFRRDLFTTARG